jgi:hypothetical protein
MIIRYKQAKKNPKHMIALFVLGLLCVLLTVNSHNILQVVNTDHKARKILLRPCCSAKMHCMQLYQTKKAYFISDAKYHPMSPPTDIMVNPLTPPPPYQFSQLA